MSQRRASALHHPRPASWDIACSHGETTMNKRFALAIAFMCLNQAVPAQQPLIRVRVTDVSLIEGLAGIVLLVNPGPLYKSQAFVTDSSGVALIPRPDCEVCTISAIDPRKLFEEKTTEFSKSTSSLEMAMRVLPLIDQICLPGTISVHISIIGSDGSPYANHPVILRPSVIDLGESSFWPWITAPDGLLNAGLVSGCYTIAGLQAGKPLEAQFCLSEKKSKGSIQRRGTRLSICATAPPTPVAVHLSDPDSRAGH